jgi:protocatechuate 3,4-dioxygenase beta subunit
MAVGSRRVYEIELFHSPPRGAEGLTGPGRRYGTVVLDEGRSRFVCGLQAAGAGIIKHESFFIDLDRNGSLQDVEIVKAKPVFEGLTALEFGAIDLTLQGADPPCRHRVFVHTNKYGPLYLASHCYTKGRIALGNGQVEAALLDYNCDGRYAAGKVTPEAIGSLGPRELDYDLIGWDADRDGKIEWTEQHYVGSYAICGDEVYRIDCAPDGLTVTVTELDLPMGKLQMPGPNAFVRLVGPLGPFSLLMPEGTGAVPAGTYPVDCAVLWDTPDMNGTATFRKSGRYFEKPWIIRAGATTVIEPNELVVTAEDEQRFRARTEARSPRRAEPPVRSLLGEPLGNLNEFRINLGEEIAGKRILLCFFDANQRPSRHCITRIARQQEQLKEKGLVVVAISTSSLLSSAVKKWLNEQDIWFTVGEISGDIEQTKTLYGIRALPWLILADRNHVVTAEGFAVSELDAKIGDTRSPADAAEDPDKAIITVMDKQGNPLADVHVTETETQEQFTTDVRGQFICKLSDQMRFFCAVDKHHALALIGRLGPGQRQLNMELLPARVVSGQVADPNGKPLAGVQIAPLPMSSFYTLTNEEGQFDIGWLPDWEPRGGLCLLARHVERNLAVLVDISRQAIRVDIQLAPALALSGTVTATEGTPLSGATVSLVLRKWNWGCGTPVKRAVTDGRGRFTLPALPQLQEYELHVRAVGYVTEELTTGVINVVKDREQIGPIVLSKRSPPAGDEMGRLRVRVVDENFRPVDVTSAQIWKKQADGGTRAESVLLVSTGTPGLYEIDQIPVGKYPALSIHEEGFAPFRLSDVQVCKEPPEVLTCKLSRGGTIEGVVTDDAGKPLAGLPVVINSILFRRDVTTDSNGYFIAEHLPDTHYSVIVEPESESPYETTVLRGGTSCGAKDLRIVVRQKREVKAPTSLVGTSIWQWSQLSLPLERSKVAGKAILLCLFDMSQRPSRNCLQQLGAKAKELEERGVIVATAHVSTTDQGKVDEWTEESGIVFPIGLVQHTEGSTVATSHVQSLPWLILTDRHHVVRAEGFPLDELDTKLAEGLESQEQ